MNTLFTGNIIWSLVLFFSAILILLLAFALAFKPIIRRLVDLAADHVPTYALAYVKCSLGAVIAAGITFKATWQPVTLGQTLNWAVWDWIIHIGEPVLSFLLYIQAFINQDWASAEIEKRAKSSTNPPFPTP